MKPSARACAQGGVASICGLVEVFAPVVPCWAMRGGKRKVAATSTSWSGWGA